MVSVYEYAYEIQDAGIYDYRLIEVLNKEEAPIDVRPPRKPSQYQ